LPLATPPSPTSVNKQMAPDANPDEGGRGGGLRCENYGTLMNLARHIDLIVPGPHSLFQEAIEEGALRTIPTSFTLTWKCACLVRPGTFYAKGLAVLVDRFVEAAAMVDHSVRKL